jgi:hypothetical protein
MGFQQLDFSTSTGISDISKSGQVLVFPNPFTYQFSIEIKGKTYEKMEYHLYNTLGEKLLHIGPYTIPQSDDLQTVHATSLLPGIYHLTIYLYSGENRLAVYNTTMISI